MILPLLLHHANRVSKNHAYTHKFYVIKDLLLKRGIKDGYDIQHIPGKPCYSCRGTGWHEKYSMYPPYKVYDTDGCWHCNASGFYKMPMWICLQRVKFGPYLFHKPLKRELMITNPFTEKKMGWKVSERQVIEGYVTHKSSWFGVYALLILFFIYDQQSFKGLFRDRTYHLKWRWKFRLNRWRKFFTWEGVVIEKPGHFIRHYQYADGYRETDPDLPF